MLFNLPFAPRNSSAVYNSIWAIVLFYCLIAFLPNVFGAGTGLDSSWTYGLSYASLQRLVFGKDLIFTYGPLGYLVGGAALEGNFFHIYLFRLLIHILFFTSIFFQLIQCKTLAQKLVLFSATVFLSSGMQTVGIQTEYQIVLLALLSSLNKKLWQSKHLRIWSLCLGCLSGLALLSKFTIGISTFVLFFICLSVSCYRAIKSKYSIKLYTFAIVDFLIALGSTLIAFLQPDRKQGFLIILTCLTISGCISLIMWTTSFFPVEIILSKINIKASKHQDVLQGKGLCKHELVRECSFYLVYSFGLFIIALKLSPLIAYLKGSLEISSGYSSAMVTVGSGIELGCAISIILLTLVLVSSSLKIEDLALSLCLCWVLFLVFKHGFVRADGHTAIFASLAPFLIALCFIRTTHRAAQTKCFWGYLCTLAIIMLGFSANPIGLPGTRLTQMLSSDFVLSRLVEWSNPIQYRAKTTQESAAQLSKMQFSAELRKLVGNYPIDVIPSEISLVAANHLNWKPRPVFQSYAAYTQFLDNANFRSLSKKDRNYIIYSFNSIDGRHPFFDEPKTFFNLFCNYKLLSKIPELIQIPSAQFALLEKRSTDICLPSTVQVSKSLEWNVNEILETNEKAMVRARFKFNYSLLGKIYRTLFRAAPIRLWVNYVDGSRSVYRMVSDNATNGIIVSHLARNDQEAFSLFNNILPLQVRSFSIHTNNPLIYQKNVELQLSSYSQSVDFVNSPSFLNLAQLKGINFLSGSAKGTVGSFDSIEVSRSRKTLALAGWAARPDKDTSDPIWLLITDGAENKPLGILKTGDRRPDVAQFFHEPSYTLSGWSGTLDASELAHGKHIVKAWFFDPDTFSALPMGSKPINMD
jgi:hypothetical protein